MDGCSICERVALAGVGRNPYLVTEMPHSIFVVGDHQWHRGYAVVALKEHVREPYHLPPDVQAEHLREVMRSAEALERTFQPVKMNLSCYGNADAADDPHPRKDPWEDVARSSERTITPARRGRSRRGSDRTSRDPPLPRIEGLPRPVSGPLGTCAAPLVRAPSTCRAASNVSGLQRTNAGRRYAAAGRAG